MSPPNQTFDLEQTTTVFNNVTRSMDSLRTQISISGLKIPRFDSFNNVFEFLTEYELITTGLDDKQKILLLAKAFPPGCHRSYYESDLAPLAKINVTWSHAKDMIVKRFADSDDRSRHLVKLREISYDPESSSSLLDYVEDVFLLYKKAYPKDIAESTAVDYVKAAIPKSIRQQLNMYHGYREANSEEELKKAVKQYDIMRVSAPKSSASRELTRDITEIIQGAIRDMRKEISESQKGVVAALKLQEEKIEQVNRMRFRSPEKPTYNAYGTSRSSSPIQRSGPSRPPSPGYYRQDYRQQNGDRYNQLRNVDVSYGRRSPTHHAQEGYNRPYVRVPQNIAQPPTEMPVQQNQDVAHDLFDSRRYQEQFGKPPRACSFCGLQHWDKHCPYNLKG